MFKQAYFYLFLISVLIQSNLSAQPIGGFGITFETNSSTSYYPKITSVNQESPAHRANVAIGDYITQIGSVPTQYMSSDDVRRLLTGQIGTSCSITVWRNNVERAITFYRYSISVQGEFGVTLETNSSTSYYPKITGINPVSPAQKANIEIGDYITKVGSASTQYMSVDDVKNLLAGQVGTPCSITVWRNNVERAITFHRYELNNIAPGEIDHIYHVKAIHNGKWEPLPGYTWLTSTPKDYRTRWVPGKVHPSSACKAISTTSEGYWIPLPGYSFISKNDIQTIWTPGLNYPDKKIKSGQVEGTWEAYPGYVFKNPAVSLEVVPVPPPTSQSSSRPSFGLAVIQFGIGALIQFFFGPNMLSDYLYQEGIKDGVNYLKQ